MQSEIISILGVQIFNRVHKLLKFLRKRGAGGEGRGRQIDTGFVQNDLNTVYEQYNIM